VRQLRYIDFDCANCGAMCTRFVYYDTDTCEVIDDEQRCEVPLGEVVTEETVDGPITYPSVYDSDNPDVVAVCRGVLVPREETVFNGYMKTIARGNGDFADRERARLERRSEDHWRRQGRDEAIDRERALFKRHGMVGGVK
jgi:L-fucose isomerase-like protein